MTKEMSGAEAQGREMTGAEMVIAALATRPRDRVGHLSYHPNTGETARWGASTILRTRSARSSRAKNGVDTWNSAVHCRSWRRR